MEPSKHFDEQIKQAMEGFESQADSGAWDLFEQKLGEAEMTEADDLFRERLDNIQAPVQPGGWEAMQQLIEADEAAEMIEQETGIDNLVNEKLSNFEVPFQNKHWALMAHRLEEEFTLRKQIHRFKAIEISLVALLLLTIVRFLPFADELFPQPAAEMERQEIQPPGNQATPTVPSENILLENNEVEDSKGEVLSTPIAAVSTNQSSENLAGAKAINEDTENESIAFENELISEDISSLSSISPSELTSVSSMYDAQSPIDEYVEQSQNHQRKLLAQMNGDIERLSILGPERLESKFSWEELPVLKPGVFQKERQLRFSIFTSNDVNYVTTPADKLSVFDTTVATSAQNTLAAGYGGGILMSWKRNKTEFQTGGIYSFKRYMPNTPVFLFKTLNYYIKEDFHGIQLDILQVPVSVNYHFKDYGKWRFYGSAGVAGNFVTSSVYEIESEQTEAFDPLNPPSGPDDFRTIRKEIEFPDGLADGGELRDNLYFTLNAGIGVERYLTPKWVIFFQPNYQHFMSANGVGANDDKIHTTSLYLGTKFSLK